MSDEFDTAHESAEAGQSPEETSSPAPWGDDFNAERAWQTITHLRGREKELESEAKRFQRIREDDEARREFLAELGYDIADEDDETDDDLEFGVDSDEDPVADLRKELSELRAAEDRRAQRELRDQFDSHVNRLAEAAGWELDEDDRLLLWAKSASGSKNNTPTPGATEKAFQAFIDREEKRLQARFEQRKASKKAPHFSSSGKGATKVPDLNSERERIDYVAERLSQAG